MSQETAASAADFVWCEEILQDVSRTFALSVSQLENPIANELCVGYLLCRLADTIEDATHIPPAEQTHLLDQYRRALIPEDVVTVGDFMTDVTTWLPDDRDAEWELVSDTARLVATFESLPASTKTVMRPPIHEMIQGMSLFIDRYEDDGGLRIQTIDELETYCWYVAGTVGELITGLVARDASDEVQSRLMETASSFGLLLQHVNIIKDFATDYERENNAYVPEAVLAKHGLEHEDIADASQREAFEPVIQELVREAEQYIEDTRTWLGAVPERRGNTLSACALPFLLAVATLRELKSRPGDVIGNRDVKISRDEVFAIVATLNGDDTPSLETLQTEIQAGPYHLSESRPPSTRNPDKSG